MLVGYASYIDPTASAGMSSAEAAIHHGEIYVGVLIGAVTLSGSVIAFGKLSGRIRSAPVVFPGQHMVNLALGIAMIGWSALQLQGKAPVEVQVPNPRVAATFNIGGPICASVCTVLR